MKKSSNKEEKEILFSDFVFRPELEVNVTIRRGVKWYGAYGEYIARPSVKNTIAAMDRYQKIKIIATDIYHFCDLPARVTAFEHIVECVDYNNLLAVMEKDYDGFDVMQYVTVVYFHLIEDE